MTDEEMFQAVKKKNSESLCCLMEHQGSPRATAANCTLHNTFELIDILKQIADIEQ